MAKQTPDYDVIDELRGSEQHHPLKNRPGEKGDPDHTDDDLQNAKPDDGAGDGGDNKGK